MRLVVAHLANLGGAPVIGGRGRAGNSPDGRYRPNREARRGRRRASRAVVADPRAYDKPLARRGGRRRRPRWSEPVLVGDSIRVQALEGRRATIVPVREGLWLLGDMDEQALEEFTNPKTAQSEIGIAPLLPLVAPLMIAAATTALNPDAQGPGKDVMNKVGRLFRKRNRRPRAPQPEVIDAYFEDDDEVELGCAGRRCRCRR